MLLKRVLALCFVFVFAVAGFGVAFGEIARKIKRNYNVKVGQVFDVVFEVDWEDGMYFDTESAYNDHILKLEKQFFVPAGAKGAQKPSQVIRFRGLDRGQARVLFVRRYKHLYNKKVLNSPSYRVTITVR